MGQNRDLYFMCLQSDPIINVAVIILLLMFDVIKLPEYNHGAG